MYEKFNYIHIEIILNKRNWWVNFYTGSLLNNVRSVRCKISNARHLKHLKLINALRGWEPRGISKTKNKI